MTPEQFMAEIEGVRLAHKGKRGWKKAAAERLGCTPSFVSKILNEGRRPGDRACRIAEATIARGGPATLQRVAEARARWLDLRSRAEAAHEELVRLEHRLEAEGG